MHLRLIIYWPIYILVNYEESTVAGRPVYVWTRLLYKIDRAKCEESTVAGIILLSSQYRY